MINGEKVSTGALRVIAFDGMPHNVPMVITHVRRIGDTNYRVGFFKCDKKNCVSCSPSFKDFSERVKEKPVFGDGCFDSICSRQYARRGAGFGGDVV